MFENPAVGSAIFAPSRVGYLFGGPNLDHKFMNLKTMEDFEDLCNQRTSSFLGFNEGLTTDGADFIKKSFLKYGGYLAEIFWSTTHNMAHKSLRESIEFDSSAPNLKLGGYLKKESQSVLMLFAVFDRLLDCMRPSDDKLHPERGKTLKEIARALKTERYSDERSISSSRGIMMDPSPTIADLSKGLQKHLDDLNVKLSDWGRKTDEDARHRAPGHVATVKSLALSSRASQTANSHKIISNLCRLALAIRLLLAVSQPFSRPLPLLTKSQKSPEQGFTEFLRYRIFQSDIVQH